MQPIRDRYLTVLVEVEQKLLNCPDLHSCYGRILEQVGQVVNASRSYLIEATDDIEHSFSAPIAEWCVAQTEGVVEQETIGQETIGSIQALDHRLDWQRQVPQPTISGWIAALRRDEIIVEHLSFLPAAQEQQAMPEVLLVLLPLLVQGELYGAIGLEHWLETGQGASELEIKLEALRPEPSKLELLEPSSPALQMLRGVALAFSFKLERSHYQKTLKEMIHHVQRLNHDLDNLVQRHTLRLQKSLNFEALLKRITDRVRDSLDQQQILQTAVQELATGLGTYSCDAALYDLEQGTSTIAYEYINCDVIAPARGTFFQLANYPEIYAQLLQGEPLQFCWITVPDTPRRFKAPLVVLGCPIIDDQGVIGDLWLYDSVETYFETEEVRLVEQVANQCAIALRQARLYQEAQAQVQKLEHLNYLKDDFLNTVSHELRSPMANIEMAIQMLELLLFSPPRISKPTCAESAYEPEIGIEAAIESASSFLPHPSAFQQSLRYFRMLQDECVRETNLINDLLDLSRLEAGTEPIFLTTIHLQAWIPHVVEPFLERARNQQQYLHVDIAEDLPALSTDLSGLERILSELLHNACKYTPPGEAIRVSARLEPVCQEKWEKQSAKLNFKSEYLTPIIQLSSLAKMLCLRVSNSGVEIPSLELPRIFDKFYRIPSHDPWKHGGTGLGLTLVKRLVEHLGATIEVESSHNQVIFTIVFLV